MNKRLTLLSGAALLGAFCCSAAKGSGDDDPAAQARLAARRAVTAELGQPAPDFELGDTDGKRFKLSEQRGRVVVLEWFNPDCPYVVEAHGAGGALETLGNRAAKQNVVWVAINSGHRGNPSTGSERNQRAKEELAIEYPILLDESSWVGAAYGAKTTPHMFVIDAKGKLVYAGGHADRESGANLIEAVLAELAKGAEPSTPRTQNFGCGVKYPTKAELGLLAPSFELPGLGGETVRLSDLRGQVVVLEWFNPECPVVKAAHDKGGALEDAAARWTQKGVAWIAINSGAPGKQGAGAELNQRAAKKWGLAHPLLLDESGKTGRAFGATTTPHMFVIDPRGLLVYRGGHADRSGTSWIDQTLGEITAGKPISQPETKNTGCSVKYAD